MQHDPGETQACRQSPWAPPWGCGQVSGPVCAASPPPVAGTSQWLPGQPWSLWSDPAGTPTLRTKVWLTEPGPKLPPRCWEGNQEHRGQRSWVLVPAPSLTSCVTSSGGPSLRRSFPWVTVAVLSGCPRCCEDPKTDLGHRAVRTLTGRPGSCRDNGNAPPLHVQSQAPQSGALPSPSRAFCSTWLSPFSLSDQEAKTRTRSISMSPVLGIAPSTTQITGELNPPGSLMPLLSSSLVLCTTSTCPHAEHTCAIHMHTCSEAPSEASSRPPTFLRHSFPPQSPSLTPYQLILPASLSFRATGDKGLIC